jgi:hypothetical protein
MYVLSACETGMVWGSQQPPERAAWHACALCVRAGVVVTSSHWRGLLVQCTHTSAWQPLERELLGCMYSRSQQN